MYISCYHYINIHHNIRSTIITRNFEIECAKLLVKHLVRGPRYDIVLCDFMRIKEYNNRRQKRIYIVIIIAPAYGVYHTQTIRFSFYYNYTQ